MENKVVLYNSNDIKIGETYVRRAKQLVSRQRANWIDENQTAIRFYPEMENMDGTVADTIALPDVQTNQLCFAPFEGGYYYPAVTGEVFIDRVKVVFLDGYESYVPKEQVMELQEAFNSMEFQGKWKNGWFYFKGILSSHQPLIMCYDDGDVEHINLNQLRGVIPK